MKYFYEFTFLILLFNTCFLVFISTIGGHTFFSMYVPSNQHKYTLISYQATKSCYKIKVQTKLNGCINKFIVEVIPSPHRLWPFFTLDTKYWYHKFVVVLNLTSVVICLDTLALAIHPIEAEWRQTLPAVLWMPPSRRL